MVANPFTEHPHSTGERYGEHLAVAMGVSRQLAAASIAAFIHALLPAFHETTASDKIRALHDCLDRGDRDGLRRDAQPTVAEKNSTPHPPSVTR